MRNIVPAAYIALTAPVAGMMHAAHTCNTHMRVVPLLIAFVLHVASVARTVHVAFTHILYMHVARTVCVAHTRSS